MWFVEGSIWSRGQLAKIGAIANMVNMSKQRPSASTRFWGRRIFRNTFTRNGRLQKVKGWSVKIQHQGLRRTISLGSPSRQAAALEARSFHDVLLSRGWDAALEAQSGAEHKRQDHADAWPKSDARYWRARLVQRRHPVSAGGDAPWSARIGHGVTSYYFPVGADERAAATRAAEIYRTIVAAGWETACRRFPRELTLGFHWGTNPVAWTYATLCTEVAEGEGRSPGTRASGVRVGLVEPERGLQRALARHLSGMASVHGFSSGEEGLRGIPRQRIDLVLVNEVLPDMAAAQFANAMKRFSRRLPVVVYSSYEDSNQLFLSVPGGALAYLLKRTPPEQLLAPIEGLLEDGTFSHDKISEHVRQYFDLRFLWRSGEDHAWMGLLTPREKQILNCLSKGYVDKEIADELGISAWTVHGHVKNIFEKLNVHSRTAAVVKYLHK
jgi:DNA-binding NarL/FixJ family response regulator